jgi:hypothetical protein
MSEERKARISYLWFAGKDGWQVTSFDPREDAAIGIKEDIGMYVSLAAYEQAQAEIEKLKKQNEILKEALEFYANEFCWDRDEQFTVPVKNTIHDQDIEWFNEEQPKKKRGAAGKTAREALKEVEETT